MASFLFDYAKGRWVEKFMLPVGGDNIVVVLFQSSGLQADATLNSYPSFKAITDAGNLEATFTNYIKKVLSAVDITIVVNTTTGVTSVDTSDQIWNAAGGPLNNTVGAFVTFYRPASNSPLDQWLPLTKHDLAIGTQGTDMKVAVPSIGTTS